MAFQPSPTLVDSESRRSSISNVSDTATTSTHLHHNSSELHDKISSLNLLVPGLPNPDTRRWSVTSSTSSVEYDYSSEADHTSLSPLSPTKTYASDSALSPTSTRVEDGKRVQVVDRKGKARATEEEDENDENGECDEDGADSRPFAFTQNELAALVDPKRLDALERMGGEAGLLRGLGTHATKGICRRSNGSPQRHLQEAEDTGDGVPDIVVTFADGDEPEEPARGDEADKDPLSVAFVSLDERRRVYGENVIPPRKSATLFQLMWTALQDKVLVLLSVAAVVSLALGIFQDLQPGRDPNKPRVDWVEGVAVVVAIIIVVMVGSLNDWQKESQFQELNEKKEERGVKVIRDGMEKVIDIKQVLVGDIALLEPGEIIPCDGVFLSGHNVKCDESTATGESDAIKKVSYWECIALRDQIGKEDRLQEEGRETYTDCFIVSGSKVLEGYGKYVVIAVGTKSFNGRILMALRLNDSEVTPLQAKLNSLAEIIARTGSAVGLIFFIALMIRFFVQLKTGSSTRTPSQNGIAFVNMIIIAVTLVVVAVPEGLPLAVTLALAFAMRRMTEENLLVRVLGSCETMANASVVCTDKTGTLTQNVMSVVAGSIGIHAKFTKSLEQNKATMDASGVTTDGSNGDAKGSKGTGNVDTTAAAFSFDQADMNQVLPTKLKELLNESIAVNSTAFEDNDLTTGELRFVGSKTETALLKFAKEFGWSNYRGTRDTADIVQMVPFSSNRKAMCVVVRISAGKWRLYFKGASEILTKACARYVVISKPDPCSGREEGNEVQTAEVDEVAKDEISRTIGCYAEKALRTIALCYREFTSWPPEGSEITLENEVSYEDLCKDLVLLAIVGIQDPLRPGVADAVAMCNRAGVAVKMCTGDNILTARSIAAQCGIYTDGGITMEGPEFRNLSDKERLEVVPKLQILARSSPVDKQILVETLKELGGIVGVTGDGTNDGPALKTANVGFSMGTAGTEVAKEASDIILMDDNFASIVKAIMWGRCVNDSVRKFLQFQVSVNITAVIITFVSAIASTEGISVLGAVQLLWINIIMDTFAALALATDPVSPTVLDRKPDVIDAPLFSADMIKMIFGQSVYQVTIIFLLHFLGSRILGLDHSPHSEIVVQTLVFNTFVFAQIFNSVNCRGLDNHSNIFLGITKNWYFITITLIEIGGQVLIIFFGGAAFQVTRIGRLEWGISLALGFLSIPLGMIIRLIPTYPCERLFIKLRLLPESEVMPIARQAEWGPTISFINDSLWTFGRLRGARIRSSSVVSKSRKAPSIPVQGRVPFLLITSIPTFIASTMSARWVPTANDQPGPLSNPPQSHPPDSSAQVPQ